MFKVKNFLPYFEQINRQALFKHIDRELMEVCIIMSDIEKNFIITDLEQNCLLWSNLELAVSIINAELMLFHFRLMALVPRGPETLRLSCPILRALWCGKPEEKWAVSCFFSSILEVLHFSAPRPKQKGWYSLLDVLVLGSGLVVVLLVVQEF